MATLHNTAQKGDFAPTVLMPGDPLRAKFIADTYLSNARLVNNVRGIQGYTGEYRGKPVSVMASGMGMPSIGIYSKELYGEYDVESIIRVGSAGLLSPALKVRSVVAGMSAYSNSNYGAQFGFRGNMAPCCSFELLEKAVAALEKPDTLLRTGWRQVDRYGLFEPTNTVVVAGRPGCGKTDSSRKRPGWTRAGCGIEI